MAFGLNRSGEEFLSSHLRINGKEGRIERSWFNGSERITEIVELPLKVLVDFATLQVGWANFSGASMPAKIPGRSEQQPGHSWPMLVPRSWPLPNRS